MSEDPKQEFFSDGITEEIITALSKIPQLFVIARTSTFNYKGKSVKVKQVSEELGVQYVLEGSVRKEADIITQNPDRCIGCGLCVSTCPTDSIRLVRKPDSEQPEVPQDIVENLIRLGKARGKITTPGLMKMMVKSKVDRFLTMGSS
jgi:NAD-dependent dihydropyrimidine dehydrogenase PreA subunit